MFFRLKSNFCPHNRFTDLYDVITNNVAGNMLLLSISSSTYNICDCLLSGMCVGCTKDVGPISCARNENQTLIYIVK
jgi:hypothetical protein